MPPTTTRKSLRQSILKKLYNYYPTNSTSTSVGTTSTLVDTVLTAGAVDFDYLRAWLYIVETVTSGPTYGEVSRVTNQSSGTLTVSPAFSLAVQTGTDYEIHKWFNPNYVNDKIDEVLQSLEYEMILPLTNVSLGDFETWASSSSITGWTASNVTLAQESTTVRHGRYSAKLTLTADAGYIQSPTLNVEPGINLVVSTEVFCTSGDSAILRLINIDDSNATLESAQTDQTGWSKLQFQTVIPASGCERVAVRLEGVTDTDVVYFDHCSVLKVGQEEIEAPSHAEWSFDLKSVVYYPRGPGISSQLYNYQIGKSSPKFWSHHDVARDETAVNPYRVYLHKPVGNDALFMRVDVDYAAFAGSTAALKDADTTKAPADIVIPLVTVLLMEERAAEIEDILPEASKSIQRRADIMRKRELSDRFREFRAPKGKVTGTLG